MNRQLRRANERSDKRREKEKERKRSAPLRPQASTKTGKSRSDPAPRKLSGGILGRKNITGVLFIITIILMVMQAVLPNLNTPQGNPTLFVVVQALYYAMFGFYGVVWIARMGANKPLYVTIAVGVGFALLLQMVAGFLPLVEPSYAVLAASLPATILGAMFGQWMQRQYDA